MEIIEAQEQLQRARDNLRHVEEGIKKTATSSNLRLVLYTYPMYTLYNVHTALIWMPDCDCLTFCLIIFQNP